MRNIAPSDGQVSVDFSESLSEIPETEIMDIDEIKEKFGLMVEEIALDVSEALDDASKHASSHLGDKSWRLYVHSTVLQPVRIVIESFP